MRHLKFPIFALLISITTMIFAGFSLAQEASAIPSDGIIAAISAFVLPFISNFAATHPIVATIFGIMAMARILIKPAFSFARAIADATPSPADNKFIDDVEHSKAYKTFAYILDLFTSIKLIPPKK